MAVAWTPQPNSRLLLNDTTSGDPLDQWLAGTNVRVDLQAQLGWAGMQDGYLAAGASDNANPFQFVYWLLDPGARQHCGNCPTLAAGSPYNVPGSGGNELWQTPGDGNTECGAGCKCSLSYGPGPTGIVSIDQERLATFLPQNMPAPAGVDISAEGADYSIGDQGMPPDGNTGGAVQTQVTASPGPSGPPPTTRDWLPQVTARATLPAGTDTLSDGQKAALDRFRTAADAWDAIADGLPLAPYLFQVTDTGEVTAGSDALDALAAEADALPYWEFLTGDQQHELQAMIDAIVDFGDATDALDYSGGGEFAEWDSGYTFGYPNQPRDAHGRYGPTGNTGHQGEGKGGTGGAGGGKAPIPAGAGMRVYRHQAPAAGYDVQLVHNPDGTSGWKAQRVDIKGVNHDIPGHEKEVFGTHAEAVARTHEIAHEHELKPLVTYTHEQAKAEMEARIGRTLTDADMAGLAGALPGEHVFVGRIGTFSTVAADGMTTVGMVQHFQAGENALHPEEGCVVMLHYRATRGDGEQQVPYDPHQVREQVLAARRLGIDRIETKTRNNLRGAVHDVQVLTRLGFNARLDAQFYTETRGGILDRVPASLGKNVRTLLDVMKSAEGRDWVSQNVFHPHLEFDVGHGTARGRTQSWKVFNLAEQEGGAS